MEALFGHYHAGGCLLARDRPGALARDARPPCAVLAQALRSQGDHAGRRRMPGDV